MTYPRVRRSRDITSEPLPAPALRSPTSVSTISRNNTITEGGVSGTGAAGDPPSSSSALQREASVAETVVEIGPDGETREWRVGAVEINPSGEMEREWGMGRV